MSELQLNYKYRPDASWHEIGSVGEPAFANSWVNYDAGFATAAYRIDSEGWVHLKGLVKNGSFGAIMFTLPDGYRPLKGYWGASVSNNYPAYIAISTAGAVSASGTGGPSNAFVSLDGIRFPAWQNWSEFGNYRPLSGIEMRTSAQNEFTLGLWKRKTGMVEYCGIAGPSPTAGKFAELADLSVKFSAHVPAIQNTAAQSYHQISPRLAAYSSAATTTFTIATGEFGSIEIESKWIDAIYENSWVDFGNSVNDTWPGLQYWKDTDGFVHLRGLVKSGSAASADITSLPTGYRPAAQLVFPTMASGATQVCRIDIASDGDVWASSQGSTTWTSLAGICFYADG